MLKISENISNLGRLLTVAQEIILAYLIPSFSTQTSRNIRAQETSAERQRYINMKLDQNAEIEAIRQEKGKEIEQEELMKEDEQDHKIWLEQLLLQVVVEQRKYLEVVLKQLNDITNNIELRLKEITARIEKFDAYLTVLYEVSKKLEKEHVDLNKKLDAIHFDTSFRITIDKESALYVDVDLNELLIHLREHGGSKKQNRKAMEDFLQSKIKERIDNLPPGQIHPDVDGYIQKHPEIISSLEENEKNILIAENIIIQDKVVSRANEAIMQEIDPVEKLRMDHIRLRENYSDLQRKIPSGVGGMGQRELVQIAHTLEGIETELRKADDQKASVGDHTVDMDMNIKKMQNYLQTSDLSILTDFKKESDLDIVDTRRSMEALRSEAQNSIQESPPVESGLTINELVDLAEGLDLSMEDVQESMEETNEMDATSMPTNGLSTSLVFTAISPGTSKHAKQEDIVKNDATEKDGKVRHSHQQDDKPLNDRDDQNPHDTKGFRKK